MVELLSPKQAEILILREAEGEPVPAQARGLQVFLDGEFHTSLAPGLLTRVCVSAGAHTLEALVGDPRPYLRSKISKTQADLKGGKSYIVRVSASGTEPPVELRAEVLAERAKKGVLQTQFVNRASSVVTCETVHVAVASLAPTHCAPTGMQACAVEPPRQRSLEDAPSPRPDRF